MQNFEATGHGFSLRHVWIVCVSSLDLYLTELVSEVGLRLIGKDPPILTSNLRRVEFPLGNVLTMDSLSPTEKLLFFRDHIFLSIQYESFYRPDKLSEALSYIWTCPGKEKWTRIMSRMKSTGRYDGRTEENLRTELSLIGDRRDLIAHSADRPPGGAGINPVVKEDASRVLTLIADLVEAIDAETEAQLALLP